MSNQSYYNSYPPEKHTYSPSQVPPPNQGAGPSDPTSSFAASAALHKQPNPGPSHDPELPDEAPPSYEDARSGGTPGPSMSGPPRMNEKSKGPEPGEDERGLGATVAGGVAGGALGHNSGHTMSGATIGAVGANVAEHFMHNHNRPNQQQQQPQYPPQQQYPPGPAYGQMPPGPGYGPQVDPYGQPMGGYMPGQQPLYGKYAYKAQKEQMKMERKQMKRAAHGRYY